MIGTEVVGRHTARTEVDVERGRLRFFARVLGEVDDSVYVDLGAAHAAGHPDLPVPPTFLMGLEIETEDVYRTLDVLGIDLGDVLHAEQSFTYHHLAFAGETLVMDTRIAEVYQRRNGDLTFLVRETAVTRANQPIADLRNVLVVVGTGPGDSQ